MGYRSEIALAIATKDIPDFRAMVEAGDLADADEIQEFKDRTVWCWKMTKWYDCYDDVGRIMKAVSTVEQGLDAQGAQKEWCMEFLRLGESVEDVESRYTPNAPGWLSVNRSIEVYAGQVD